MTKKVTLGRRARPLTSGAYSRPASEPEELPAPAASTTRVGLDVERKKPAGKGGVVSPSIEGGINNPLPISSRSAEQVAEEVLALLEPLEPTARQEALDRVLLAFKEKKPADRELQMWAVSVLQALGAAIGPEGKAGFGLMMLRASLAPASVWGPVDTFMRASKLDKLTVTERQSAYSMLAGVLVRYAHRISQRSGVPLTPKLVASCCSHLASVVENSFPGYAASGLMPMLVRHRARTDSAASKEEERS